MEGKEGREGDGGRGREVEGSNVLVGVQTKRDSHSDFSEVAKKVRTHMSAVFKLDFLFYILLVYRMHK